MIQSNQERLNRVLYEFEINEENNKGHDITLKAIRE